MPLNEQNLESVRQEVMVQRAEAVFVVRGEMAWMVSPSVPGTKKCVQGQVAGRVLEHKWDLNQHKCPIGQQTTSIA